MIDSYPATAEYSFTIDAEDFDVKLHVKLTCLNESFFIWLGDDQARFMGLTYALPFCNETVSSNLYVSPRSTHPLRKDFESNFAKRISRSINKPCQLSLSVSDAVLDKWESENLIIRSSDFLCSHVENQLIDYIKKFINKT